MCYATKVLLAMLFVCGEMIVDVPAVACVYGYAVVLYVILCWLRILLDKTFLNNLGMVIKMIFIINSLASAPVSASSRAPHVDCNDARIQLGECNTPCCHG